VSSPRSSGHAPLVMKYSLSAKDSSLLAELQLCVVGSDSPLNKQCIEASRLLTCLGLDKLAQSDIFSEQMAGSFGYLHFKCNSTNCTYARPQANFRIYSEAEVREKRELLSSNPVVQHVEIHNEA